MTKGLAFYNKDFLIIKQGSELVAESITRILMTNPGERVGQPYFGVGLRNLLFNQLDDELITNLKENIMDQCSQYEPRAIINDINIEELIDEHAIIVKISFLMNGDPIENANILSYRFDLE